MNAATIDTKAIYTEVYRADGHDYGSAHDGEMDPAQFNEIRGWIQRLGISEDASVLEVGCGLGHLHVCHPGWRGVEYSTTAVELARKRHGDSLPILEGDARNLPVVSESIDLLYTFAAFEHVPQLEKAFAEVERVVKPGGVAVIGVAWNCRPWTVKKLQQRPYSELSLSEKIGKWLIPLRNNLYFRMFCSIPARLWREIRMAAGMRLPLEYSDLHPDFTLWDRYEHISDDDAFVKIDAHSGINYFVSRGWACVSHPGFMRRFGCRGSEIVVIKPS